MIKKAALIAIGTFFLTLVIFALISLFYAFFLLISGSTKATEILTKATIYLFFLRLTGILAFVLIGITMVLGALRGFLIVLYKNASFWEVHTKWTSSVGVGMAISHFVIYLLYQNRLGINFKIASLLPTNIAWTATSNILFAGLIALITIAFNTLITHVPGVTGKKWWRPLHIINYLALFLIVYHAFFGGGDSTKPLFRTLYFSFLALAIFGIVYRLFKVYRKRVGLKSKPEEKLDPSAKSYDIKLDFPSKPSPEVIMKIVDDISKDSDAKVSVNSTQANTLSEKPTKKWYNFFKEKK